MDCEVCGDEADADSLEECESCSYKMCSSCNFDHGLCRDCTEEQGLLDSDHNCVTDNKEGPVEDDEDGGWLTPTNDSDDLWDSSDDEDDEDDDFDDLEEDEPDDKKAEDQEPEDEDKDF